MTTGGGGRALTLARVPVAVKALSNQKFHDLKRAYGGADGDKVGIITGDVTCVWGAAAVARAGG